jgi:glucose/arabinose dehydrogenase
LFATDHGPSGFANELFRRDNDELNAVRAGGDYGWPMSVGEGYVSRSIDPITAWSPAIAPSGLAVYTGRDFPQWTGNLFVGALRGTQLRRVAVSPRGDRWQASEQEPVIENLGRVRAVAMGPDGHLYITTSNRDGRATTHPGDDHVFRLKRKR